MNEIITGEGTYRDESGNIWEWMETLDDGGTFRHAMGLPLQNGCRLRQHFDDYGNHSIGEHRILSRIESEVETWKAGDECEWQGGKYKVLAVATPRVCTCAWIVNDEGRFETVETCDLRRPVKRREWTVVDATFKGTDMISVTLECTGNIEWSAEKNELIVAALNASEDGAK